MTVRDTHSTRCWRCNGLRAGARLADLLEMAYLMATAAAGMIEAKKMQRIMRLQLLCAEGSKELNCGRSCGRERAVRVAVRVRCVRSDCRALASGRCSRESHETCLELCGVFCCGGSGLQRLARARSCAIRAWAVGHAWIGTGMSAHELGREDAGAGRATEGGGECRHCVCLYTGQKS